MARFDVLPEDVHKTLGEFILVDGFHLVIDLKKSHGAYIVNASDGSEYLDCYAYFSSLPVGHNHPKMFDPDFMEELKRVAVANPANSDIYSTEYARFVKRFAELAMPDHFRYLFFIAGGAPAVENALKVAFDWKVRKNYRKGAKSERGHKIIHFRQAFHGRTGYCLSLTNTDPVKTDYFPKFNWPRIPNPKLRFPVTQQVLEEVEKAEQEALTMIKDVIAEEGEDIAAIIIEPIQGEGGDNHFRGEFLRALRQVADESDVMLIFDEVQTGCGTTGKMWCCEHFDVWPDILVFGKKTQICGIMVSARVDEVPDNVFHVSSRINSTWGGNLVDMVRGIRGIEIMHEEKLIENAAETGRYFLRRLEELAQESGGLVSNVRGRGFMLAFDLPTTDKRDAFRQACWDAKFATLACGERSVRFRPSLIFTKDHVDEAVEKIRNVLKKVRI